MNMLIVALAMLVPAVETFAQSEAALVEKLAGRQVKVKLDMPASKDGIDIYSDSTNPVKWSEYANRLKEHGRGLRAGDTTVITSVRVKEKHIEIQLGGGGYGTIGDSLKTIVVPAVATKTDREKRVEQDLKKATDPESRKNLQGQLDRMRNQRERDQRLAVTLAQGQQADKRAQAENKALETGSRFNIRFDRPISQANVTPDLIMQTLGQYLEFQP